MPDPQFAITLGVLGAVLLLGVAVGEDLKHWRRKR